LPSNVPFAIAGGSLAAIVVGAIILFVAIAAFGGKKGYGNCKCYEKLILQIFGWHTETTCPELLPILFITIMV
jgi:hypothetical protein